MQMRPTESRERVKGGDFVPFHSPLRSPEAAPRGETPYAPIFSMTFSVMTEVTKPPGFVGIISREC